MTRVRQQSKVRSRSARQNGLRIAGLFAGIGGLELGFHAIEAQTSLLCEIESGARAVLSTHFGDARIEEDVRQLRDLGEVDVVAAGFPCQDLSQAGPTHGIKGARSGLVKEVFRLVDVRAPRWLLLENVPFMLQLDRGRAMDYLVSLLEERKFTWAYRVLDARSFGIPQRRKRVILLASRTEDPCAVLFREDRDDPTPKHWEGRPIGFYWTEGTRGLGWTIDGVPTLKGGSGVGIPSAPAIWDPKADRIFTPDVRDAEALQGFDRGWTEPAASYGRGARWKMIGNAVCVAMSRWVAEGLSTANDLRYPQRARSRGDRWGLAAWGRPGEAYDVEVSEWVGRTPYRGLEGFLEYPGADLSYRATRGFRDRLVAGSMNYPPEFLGALERHLERMRIEQRLDAAE